MEKIRWIQNTMPETISEADKIMSAPEIRKAGAFHESFPQYRPTPLRELKALARALGLGGIYVKDESYRFGLKAFKVLGASYAMGRYICNELHRDISEMSCERLRSPEIRRQLGQKVFYTATDGNHGRAVAWAAGELGHRAVVRMPSGSTEKRRSNIESLGAEVTIEDMNYDDCVRLAASQAKERGGVLIQDTAMEGYYEIPAYIMQGYGTMAREAMEQLGNEPPTHVFIQAGVGSLAAAVLGYFVNEFPDSCPKFVILEASAADCFFKSAEAGDGSCRSVKGELKTLMAGLACGEPNVIAWEIIKNHSFGFASCPDWVTELGMRRLAKPLKGDCRIISGESGALGLGFLMEAAGNPEYGAIKEALGLNEKSRVLLFSSEGDTDPDRYREITEKAE